MGAHPHVMGVWQDIQRKLGLGDARPGREPLRVFLLDDDTLRHEWFARRFSGDLLDVAEEPVRAIELLSAYTYDAVFLDHDLLPHHYRHQGEPDDEHTGYAVAAWLAANPRAQGAATIIAHTRNADGAMRMVELLRRVGRQAEYVPFPVLAQAIKKYWQR